MNYKLAVISLLIATAYGCASKPPAPVTVEAPKVTALMNQTLSTDIAYNNTGVKIEWNCTWPTGISDMTCIKTTIKAIEVTKVTAVGGNSSFEINKAQIIGEMHAKASLVEFMKQDITSKRVLNTMGKNLEKANDRIKQRISDTEVVAMSDSEADKDTNFAIRENTNETVRNLTEGITTYAQGKISGVMVKEVKRVGPRELAVTIRWSKENAELVNELRKAFGN